MIPTKEVTRIFGSRFIDTITPGSVGVPYKNWPVAQIYEDKKAPTFATKAPPVQ